MGILFYLKDIITVVSVLSLLVIGLLITLKSGVVSVGGGNQCGLVWRNFSQLVVTLAGLILFLSIVQQMIGIHLGPK